MASHRQGGDERLARLALVALGVVYGDIGTSPLYAVRECFSGEYAVAATHENVLGVLSLMIWSLVVVISIKYLVFVMRADNHGEGGILALTAIVRPLRELGQRSRALLVTLGLFGAALLYGDGMITPAISVLSAVEGLRVATPVLEPYVIPVTVGILVALFAIQHRGTTGVGMVFGPITLVWFLNLAALGVGGLVQAPQVLEAVWPGYAFGFFARNGWHGLTVLAAVFLVVTGGEALYADMGHFGARPIRLTWFSIVLPALFLNYLGQGALLLEDPAIAHHPFYHLAPRALLYPQVVLATAATIIASQAVISGCFSLTRQAIQLGYFPRLPITHTSEETVGQIYVGPVNWLLMLAAVGLVWGFGSSSNLAAAYGVAVATTMAVTTVLLYVVAVHCWRWTPAKAGALTAVFLLIDAAFLAANLIKLEHGGWFPVVVAAGVFTVMTTWHRGREILGRRLRSGLLPLERFVEDVGRNPPLRVPGSAVFMTGNLDMTPPALLHNLKHNHVLHEQVAVLTVVVREAPRVPRDERIEVRELGHGVWGVRADYGFMETPRVHHILARMKELGFEFEVEETSFFLGRETLIPSAEAGMALWRKRLFAFLSRNAQPATAFFAIPPNRVVELGVQIEL